MSQSRDGLDIVPMELLQVASPQQGPKSPSLSPNPPTANVVQLAGRFPLALGEGRAVKHVRPLGATVIRTHAPLVGVLTANH